ncbi:MAG: hypothetical protein Ta2B_26920 [Termitinemataceae bacterium]|nr:MAG: hypothetical protein Ta2B_26920 [Termitinemataceae bacterium]
MNRHFFAIVFFVASSIAANAEWNNKISIGATPFSLWQSSDDSDSARDFWGLNVYNLLRPNYLPIGIFTGASVSFSKEFFNDTNIINLNKDISFEELLGPGFLVEFNDVLSVQIAVGFHLKESFVFTTANKIVFSHKDTDEDGNPIDIYKNEKTNNDYFDFGLGLGVVLQFDILLTSNVFLSIGANFIFDFDTPFSKEITYIKPFIGIGFEYDTDDLFIVDIPE